ncbi:uncharacterized protein LOC108864546 [Galendromus occidentalis]|uniref:Uncharacterized protein LOC108864546 n=1 Tax=Galendromus occidentalis TaxID=34638 RepID=A0AAJ7L535_9ACAR|nr:uncharacterized protein LOC108864546 [Galendromus occidentalis]
MSTESPEGSSTSTNRVILRERAHEGFIVRVDEGQATVRLGKVIRSFDARHLRGPDPKPHDLRMVFKSGDRVGVMLSHDQVIEVRMASKIRSKSLDRHFPKQRPDTLTPPSWFQPNPPLTSRRQMPTLLPPSSQDGMFMSKHCNCTRPDMVPSPHSPSFLRRDVWPQMPRHITASNGHDIPSMNVAFTTNLSCPFARGQY